MCDPARSQTSKITKEGTEQLAELIPENLAQSFDDYSTSSFLKQTGNNGFEWTGSMTDRR